MNKQIAMAEFDGQSFRFNNFRVRLVMRDGMAWFCAADIAKALGYVNTRNFLRLINNKAKGAAVLDTPGGPQSLVMVSEPGMYEGVLRCNLPDAESFVDWVTAEILPSIRQTGGYQAQGQIDQSDRVHELTAESIDLAFRLSAAQTEVTGLQERIELLEESREGFKARLKLIDLKGAGDPKRASRTPLTETEEAGIRALFYAEFTTGEIASLTGRGKTTIKRVRRDMEKAARLARDGSGVDFGSFFRNIPGLNGGAK